MSDNVDDAGPGGALVRHFCLAFSAMDENGYVQQGNYYMTLTGPLTKQAIELAKADWTKQVGARQSVVVQHSRCVCFGVFHLDS